MNRGAKRGAALLGATAFVFVSACSSLDLAAEKEQEKMSAKVAEAAANQGGAALRLARAARAVKDFPAAINLYKSVIAANPGDTDTVVEMGLTELEAGQVDDAIATFQTVPATSKGQFMAQLGLERVYLMQSQPARALSYADKALALDAKSPAALVGRGVALDLLTRHREAQASYRSALAIVPADVPARSNLALSLAMSGEFDEAIAIMVPIARAPSATPRLRQNLALIYGLKGDLNAARALSRVDLDAKTTDENLKFFAMVRGKPVQPAQPTRPARPVQPVQPAAPVQPAVPALRASADSRLSSLKADNSW
jgi:Flp pilus assembly protein TadD